MPMLKELWELMVTLCQLWNLAGRYLEDKDRLCVHAAAAIDKLNGMQRVKEHY